MANPFAEALRMPRYNPRRPHPKTARYMAALGRGGDRTMGHLTPGEVVIPTGSMTPALWAAFNDALSRKGVDPAQYVVGARQNSINPATGQPEFYRPDESGVESVADPSSGGGGSIQGPESSKSGPVGAVHASPATASLAKTGQVYQAPEGAENQGPQSGPRVQGGMIDANNPPVLQFNPETGTFGTFGTVDAGGILGGLGGLMMGGPVLGYGGYKLGTGEFDIQTFTEYDPQALATSTHEFNVGPEGREIPLAPSQGMAAERQVIEQAYTRPAAIPTPQFLGLSSSMSPLQQRTAIASQAVAGGQGQYFSPEAQAYYDNLLQRMLIDETGNLVDLDELLPIEMQYLQQVRGLTGFDTTEALLDLIANQGA